MSEATRVRWQPVPETLRLWVGENAGSRESILAILLERAA
jgi:hypothetical protein